MNTVFSTFFRGYKEHRSQTMPADYFEDPWSIARNRDIYDNSKRDDIKVTMTNEGTGQWAINGVVPIM